MRSHLLTFLLYLSFEFRVCLFQLVYILVLSVMIRKRHRRLSCYKIMIALGFYDMCQISLNSLLSGYFWLTGANYCMHPTLMYITGGLALGLWCGTCMNCFALVINRLLDIWDRQYMEMVSRFCKRTYFVLLLPLAYFLYFTFCTPPVLFNSDHTAWFFTPFTTNHKIEEYVNIPHSINNLLIVAVTTLLYGLYAKVLLRSSRGSKLNIPLQFFIQTSSICMANLTGSLIYVYMQFFETPAYFILIGHVSWMLSNGKHIFCFCTHCRGAGWRLAMHRWAMASPCAVIVGLATYGSCLATSSPMAKANQKYICTPRGIDGYTV
ncbi:unnamed protein product [Heligmosomoides polygyrus]|uniref:Serpentine Receptor, class T n=1 Tax=Heligmosomoides polygyrus TaxID=6339 RepID=A0A183FMU9_HELPZ|nr:unnamed protein product [Heligmosomoides polygyrus]